MIEKANVERILERLREVEAQLAEPGTAADQKKYRGLVREHASLRKLQDRATAYYRLVDTVESDRAMAEDPATDEEVRELAKAELVSFMDADDEARPNYVEDFCAALAERD